MDIYADNILDHFRHPRNHGELEDSTCDHEEANVECGDVLHVWVKLEPLPSSMLRDGPPVMVRSPKRAERAKGVSNPSGWPPQHDMSREHGRIVEIGWTGTGCAISQASMSLLSEEIVGMSEEKVQSLGKNDVYKLLGVPIGPRRFKCALMSLHAVKNALWKARGLPFESWVETVALEQK